MSMYVIVIILPRLGVLTEVFRAAKSSLMFLDFTTDVISNCIVGTLFFIV